MLTEPQHLPVFEALPSPEVARCKDHDGVETMTTLALQTTICRFQADSTIEAKGVPE
jgi:hypothetical protein